MSTSETLGGFLRGRRERLDPSILPGVTSTRRRTPGWRREEVARSAGVSVEWYTRLEQGRGGSPSAQVLGSIARALAFDDAEREHLFLLAGLPAPVNAEAGGDDLSGRFQSVLSGFRSGPAFVKTAAWDVAAWNDAARVVLTDYPALAPGDRNVLKILFLHRSARALLDDWERESRLSVATFRLEVSRQGPCSRSQAVLDELLLRSEDFGRMWRDQDVGILGEGSKRLMHPVAGQLDLRYSSYAVDRSPGLSLVLYTPESPSDVVKIDALVCGAAVPGSDANRVAGG